MLRRFVLAFLATITAVLPRIAFAEDADVPAFKSPPVRYVSRYEGEMLLGDRDSKRLTFWVNLTGPNHHSCGMAGKAEAWDKEHYRYSEGECTLEIVVIGRSVVLLDQGHQCKKIHCGSRTYIDGTVLFQKSGG